MLATAPPGDSTVWYKAPRYKYKKTKSERHWVRRRVRIETGANGPVLCIEGEGGSSPEVVPLNQFFKFGRCSLQEDEALCFVSADGPEYRYGNLAWQVSTSEEVKNAEVGSKSSGGGGGHGPRAKAASVSSMSSTTSSAASSAAEPQRVYYKTWTFACEDADVADSWMAWLRAYGTHMTAITPGSPMLRGIPEVEPIQTAAEYMVESDAQDALRASTRHSSAGVGGGGSAGGVSGRAVLGRRNGGVRPLEIEGLPPCPHGAAPPVHPPAAGGSIRQRLVIGTLPVSTRASMRVSAGRGRLMQHRDPSESSMYADIPTTQSVHYGGSSPLSPAPTLHTHFSSYSSSAAGEIPEGSVLTQPPESDGSSASPAVTHYRRRSLGRGRGSFLTQVNAGSVPNTPLTAGRSVVQQPQQHNMDEMQHDGCMLTCATCVTHTHTHLCFSMYLVPTTQSPPWEPGMGLPPENSLLPPLPWCNQQATRQTKNK